MASYIDTQLLVDMVGKGFIGKGLGPAVSMVQDDDFPRPHLLLGNNQGTNHVIRHPATGIAQDMGIP